MTAIRKTPKCQRDLVEIWQYTKKNWGEVQANKYLQKIELCLSKIDQEKISTKIFTKNIHYVRCEHHYIFVGFENGVVALAAFHEKMDYIARMKKRLEED